MARIAAKTVLNLCVTRYTSSIIVTLLTIIALVIAVHASEDTTHINDNENSASNERPAPSEMIADRYRKLLGMKLSEISQAITNVKKISNYEKQFKMLSILLDKIFKVLLDAMLKLTEAGYVPLDGFPTNSTILDTYSMVIENTFFLGMFALQLPDPVHEIISSHPDWRILVQYGIGFCNDTKVFDDLDGKLLDIMAQELNIIERKPDYINPNSKKYLQEKERQMSKETKSTTKQKVKREQKKRGPKLSGPRHSDL